MIALCRAGNALQQYSVATLAAAASPCCRRALSRASRWMLSARGVAGAGEMIFIWLAVVAVSFAHPLPYRVPILAIPYSFVSRATPSLLPSSGDNCHCCLPRPTDCIVWMLFHNCLTFTVIVNLWELDNAGTCRSFCFTFCGAWKLGIFCLFYVTIPCVYECMLSIIYIFISIHYSNSNQVQYTN